MTAISATLKVRTEGALRSRAARGDATAFAAVYERHHQALYRYCRSILRHDEDAQDALQSTFTRAFAALQTEERDFDLKPWLFRIAHNEAISILRRRPATDELDDRAAPGELEDRVSEREELRLLQLDLADLPERQRAALILRELNGLSHQEIAIVLDLSVSAVKQAIFDARTALFSFREGREMACEDIRRMLSDGDGRVLRGRGMRAHLRSCPDCRRFKADLQTRPRALKALAPPLPVGGAAALLAQLLGGGATAAKLLACVAIAGGGTTLAVEMRHARGPVPEAATAAPRSRAQPPRKPASIVPVVSTPQPVTATTTAQPARAGEKRHPAAKKRHARHAKPKTRRSVPVQKRRVEVAPPARTEAHAKTEQPGKADGRTKVPPGQAKKDQNPRKPPGQAKKEARSDVPPGQAKKDHPPPGQAKKTDDVAPQPPGQAKKDDPPPGQAKKDDPPPGQAKKDDG